MPAGQPLPADVDSAYHGCQRRQLMVTVGTVATAGALVGAALWRKRPGLGALTGAIAAPVLGYLAIGVVAG